MTDQPSMPTPDDLANDLEKAGAYPLSAWFAFTLVAARGPLTEAQYNTYVDTLVEYADQHADSPELQHIANLVVGYINGHRLLSAMSVKVNEQYEEMSDDESDAFMETEFGHKLQKLEKTISDMELDS